MELKTTHIKKKQKQNYNSATHQTLHFWCAYQLAMAGRVGLEKPRNQKSRIEHILASIVYTLQTATKKQQPQKASVAYFGKKVKISGPNSFPPFLESDNYLPTYNSKNTRTRREAQRKEELGARRLPHICERR